MESFSNNNEKNSTNKNKKLKLAENLEINSREDYFEDFSVAMEEISKTTSRIEIISIVSKYFKSLKNEKSLVSACYLSTGQLFPSYSNKELNIGENAIIKLISEVSMVEIKKIKEEYKKIGDFGDLIYKLKSQKKLFNIERRRNTVNCVFNKLKEVCNVQGKNSNESKLKIIRGLIREMNSLERKYFIRILEGKLKIGLALQSILSGLSLSFTEYNEEDDKDKLVNADILKTAYNRVLSFEILIENIREHGINDTLLKFCKVEPGIPLKPMLAEACKSLDEIFKKLQLKQKEFDI